MKYELITYLIIPLNEFNRLQEDLLKKIIINIKNCEINSVIISYPFYNGYYLKFEELIKIINIINENSSLNIIIHLDEKNIQEAISLISKLRKYKHNAIIVNDSEYEKITNLFIEEKFIIKCDNIKNKLLNNKQNILGLLLNKTSDVDNKNYDVFIEEDKEILTLIKKGYNFIISSLSYVFSEDIKTLFNDYKNNIDNCEIDNYINKLSELIIDNNKYYSIEYIFFKQGYKCASFETSSKKLNKEKKKNINIIFNF